MEEAAFSFVFWCVGSVGGGARVSFPAAHTPPSPLFLAPFFFIFALCDSVCVLWDEKLKNMVKRVAGRCVGCVFCLRSRTPSPIHAHTLWAASPPHTPPHGALSLPPPSRDAAHHRRPLTTGGAPTLASEGPHAHAWHAPRALLFASTTPTMSLWTTLTEPLNHLFDGLPTSQQRRAFKVGVGRGGGGGALTHVCEKCARWIRGETTPRALSRRRLWPVTQQ